MKEEKEIREKEKKLRKKKRSLELVSKTCFYATVLRFLI